MGARDARAAFVCEAILLLNALAGRVDAFSALAGEGLGNDVLEVAAAVAAGQVPGVSSDPSVLQSAVLLRKAFTQQE